MNFDLLEKNIKGELYTDELHKIIYATDASVYREIPHGVVYPKDNDDLKIIINFANKNNISLIPRTAGTSLAGQVVGKGLIVDVSRYFNKIIEINPEKKYAIVQPGVILNDLNRKLERYNLFFGPETSTSNRCMLGGMLGNNSCGAHSLIYGSVRDHILAVKVLLSDGSEVFLEELTKDAFFNKCKLNTLEGKIYNHLYDLLSNETNTHLINSQFPHPEVTRRNMGYAIDSLLNTNIFSETSENINLSKLLAGSEGTLAMFTEIKLNLVELPIQEKGLLCVHLDSLSDSFKANLIVLRHNPTSVELIDKVILDLTKENITQQRNRFFVNGDPAAIMVVELWGEDKNIIVEKAKMLKEDLQDHGFGYAFPLILDQDINKVWALRKSGLGVLSNMVGDAKPVAVIEDTAIRPVDLGDFIEELNIELKQLNLSCVYYGHLATGELHLRPILNLKDSKDLKRFRIIAEKTAMLVKKYRGSLSGEHGDGRLRGEFIPTVYGDEIYSMFKSIKQQWDPHNIFNPGKIVDSPPMDSSLRYVPDAPVLEVDTYYDFSEELGLIRSIEKCNGSADCHKLHWADGGMCPSYQATLDEKNSTRARANALREILNNNISQNPFNNKESYEVLDLCLVCKLCKAECPSNVDMAKFKTEFLQHWYKNHLIPLRSFAIAYISHIQSLFRWIPGIYNFFIKQPLISNLLKSILKIDKNRNFPLMYKFTLKHYLKRNLAALNPTKFKREILLFIDEFSNYNDVRIGIDTIKLLTGLGYSVKILPNKESARTFISKGMLKKAKKIIDKNINLFYENGASSLPILGIEPSAILGFKDDYPYLCSKELKEKAKILANNAMMIEEFLIKESLNGNISSNDFIPYSGKILVHGHCQQKAIISTKPTIDALKLIPDVDIDEIPSGCCGMAGSFGFEKEHYEISMKIGNLILFPTINSNPNAVIIAPGTSCRQQIYEGTQRQALHPVQFLYKQLKNKIN
ncbi:MAG TPA: FAD-binding protein [Bacteroidales bacterium]|nr:FAD-binding protein [Bacteroidales bacterium]